MSEDFTGFTFWINGDSARIHSSDLGIIRVSGGNRYDESLHPEIKDKSVEVSGMNGEYYFGSDFSSRQIEIDIAYDSLTEVQLRKLRKVFGRKQIGELIFDERPYKKYLVKIASPIELSYVCFDEGEKELVNFNGINGPTTVLRPTGNTMRVYKGEGTIKFIAYYPFAKSVFKFLSSEDEDSDWAVSSGILSSAEYSDIDSYVNGEFKIYNAGDIETGFRLYCPKPEGSEKDLTISYTPYIGKEATGALSIDNLTLAEDEVGFIINTDNYLIEGISEYTQDGFTTSGNIYNNCIVSGTFFKLETNDSPEEATMTVTGSLATQPLEIYYDYLYF